MRRSRNPWERSRSSLRRWSSAALLLLLASPPAWAAKRQRVYDPELALLLLTVQKQSVDLIRQEMVRQAEWMELGGLQVLLGARAGAFASKVKSAMTVDSDVIEEYRRLMTDTSPGTAGDIDRLMAEIRRYHDLRPGPPVERIPLPPGASDGPPLMEEMGVGADVTAGVKGTPAMDEPVAYAERRFGTTGPFLRRRLWNLDFYLGSFSDLVPHYRKMGYRRIYRLRAPYISFGKSAYVLSPEPGLRPRLVYCAFYGQDLFLHTRAQWDILTEAAKGQGPLVRTLTCPSCTWTLPGVKAMRSLLGTVPFTAENVVIGYDYLFAPLWQDRLLSVYENDYWRLTYYRLDAGVTVTVQPRHTDFGEILAACLGPLVRRGARRVFFGGPAAQVAKKADAGKLTRPTDFTTFLGPSLNFKNSFAGRKSVVFAGLPSPLLATREWLADAEGHGITAFDGEMSRLAEESGRWVHMDGTPVSVGIGAILGSVSSLHPEEDRAIYTIEYANQAGRESAKKEFRDSVFAALKAAARDRNQ